MLQIRYLGKYVRGVITALHRHIQNIADEIHNVVLKSRSQVPRVFISYLHGSK
jgi:hypothetical protein